MDMDHIAIACRDVDLMREWYERHLDFEVRARKSPSRPDASAPTYLVGPVGGAGSLELTPDDGTVADRRPFTGGLAHFAFRVEDLAVWEVRLDDAGVRWLGPAVDAMGGGRVRSFLDLEGNLLQLVERPRS
jgi:glyoxylase I family protein